MADDDTRSLAEAAELAAQLRVDSIRASTSAGSGHPTSSLSAADLLAVLVLRHLCYDWNHPSTATNDHLIYSKGHASPLVYSVLRATRQISEEELLTGYRRFGQRLQGHPTPILPWVDVATGSLGQGLPDGVGIALAGKYLEKLPYRVWVLCGDSEMAEGSIWEALDKASHYELGNLVVIVDVNRLGQRGVTALGWDLDAYARRTEAFGARVLTVDGHDLAAIDAALHDVDSGQDDRPTVILARTVKGKGVAEVEDSPDWHGKPLPRDLAEEAIEALGGVREMTVSSIAPPQAESVEGPAESPAESPATSSDTSPDTDPAATPGTGAGAEQHSSQPDAATATAASQRSGAVMPRYRHSDRVATRKAYGEALVALGEIDPLVVGLDAEVSNSTGAGAFAEAFPDRFFEMFIAEQQLIAAATGMAVRGFKPFASTFAAFLSRAFDFIRMGAITGADLRIVGSHAGVEIGADGPSQMALEDLAMMRSVLGSTVLYPSDAPSTVALVAQMADISGISYLRTTRGSYPVIYGPAEEFPIGGSKILRSNGMDDVTVVGAGVTVHECIGAADLLAREGIGARVIDCYSVKPIDVDTLAEAVRHTGGRLVIAEDHHPEGGLGEAVIAALTDVEDVGALSVRHLAVRDLPGSGTAAELLEAAGLSAGRIARAARELFDERDAEHDAQGNVR
ncbi:transketolase [Acidipropionibacterium jensenii]|uniref:transketolase n=3 Tax=Acidipropionibacterium jensenii TaxID=1749 RepID=UPI002648B96C|nr:transketolase [Acidipropionibacterium jensenii]MDN5996483.1 transketolase [Acidipropionibacterium jensenii]MDN6556840.1 transketolase [Acidipropionibacterium acidipropionici]